MEFDEGEDELYRGLFKVKQPGDAPDDLTVLACNKQGIDVKELLKNPNLEGLQAEAAEYRRARKKGLVEGERERLLVQLYHKTQTCTKLAKTLGKTSEVKVRPPRETDEEREAREKELARFREKSVRQVMSVQKTEIARQQLQDRIHCREHTREEADHQKKAVFKKASRERQRKRVERLQRAMRQTELMYLEGKVTLELKEQLRKESENKHLTQQAEARAVRNAVVLENTEMVKAKAAQARAQHEEKARHIQDELDERLELHLERKKNIVLTQARKREARHIAKLRKSVAISHVFRRRAQGIEDSKESLERMYAEDDMRVAQERDGLCETAASKGVRNVQRAMNASARRQLLSDVAEDRFNDITLRSVLKNQYLRKLAHDRQEQLELKKEQNRIKEETMHENRQRLERKNENEATAQRVKIEMGMKYKAAIDERRQRERLLRERRNHQTEVEKRKIEDDIKKLRDRQPALDSMAASPIPSISEIGITMPKQIDKRETPYAKVLRDISAGTPSLRPSTSPAPIPYTVEASTATVYTHPFQR